MVSTLISIINLRRALFIPYSTTSVLNPVDTSPTNESFTGILGPKLYNRFEPVTIPYGIFTIIPFSNRSIL